MVHFDNMPKGTTYTTPDSKFEVTLTKNTAVIKKARTKSVKRQRIGKSIASTLPRDERGRFLKRGQKNRFRRKTKQIKRGSKGKEPEEGPSHSSRKKGRFPDRFS